MIGLLQYELKKQFNNRKNRYIILIAIVLLGFSYFNVLSKHQSYMDDRIQILNQDNYYASLMVEYLEAYPENINVEQVAFWEKEAYYTNQLRLNYRFTDTNDWQTTVSNSIGRDKNLIFGYEHQYITHSAYSSVAYIKTLQQQIEVNQHLLDHNIEPLSSPYYPSGLNMLNQLLSKEFILILFTIVVILFLDIFSAEMDNGFFKTLYTGKNKRTTILFVKLLVSCVVTIIFSLLAIATILVFTSIRHGLGNSLYPIAIFDNNSATEIAIIPMQTYVTLGLLQVGTHLIAVVCFMAMIYFVAMDTTVTLSVLISLFIFLYIIGFNTGGLERVSFYPLATYDYSLIMKSGGIDKMFFSCWLTLSYAFFAGGISLFLIKNMDMQGEIHS